MEATDGKGVKSCLLDSGEVKNSASMQMLTALEFPLHTKRRGWGPVSCRFRPRRMLDFD